VIQDSGAGDYIATQAMQLPLTPVAIAFLVAVLMRAALGSATAAILTASALVAALAKKQPDQATLLVLAVANGVTFMTQPGDSGFWLLKEYGNLSVRQVMVNFNVCRATMALTGLAILLAYEAW
jgi:H+/gluconate symporter-like permease